jgi:hypothetical protein
MGTSRAFDDRRRSGRDLDDGEFGERFFAQIGRF